MPEKITCPKCGKIHEPCGQKIRFCTECGYNFPDSPIDRFRRVLKEEIEESSDISDSARKRLEHLAEKAELSPDKAQEIVKQVYIEQERKTCNLRLEVWARQFECDSVSCLKTKITNTGENIIDSLELGMEADQSFILVHTVTPAISNLLPSQSCEEMFASFIPKQHGDLPCSLALTARYREGRPEVWRSPLILNVKKQKEGDPRLAIQIGNINQQAEASEAGDAGRGGQHIHLDFGNIASLLKQEEAWNEVILKYDKPSSDRLYEVMPCKKTKPTGRRQRVLFLTCKTGTGVQKEVSVFSDTEIRFGRGLLRRPKLDVPLFVDPVKHIPREIVEHGKTALPPELEDQPTMRLSGHHMLMRFRGTHFEVIDTGSSNGTVLESVKLNPRQPYRLGNGNILQLANVCIMQARIYEDSSPTLGVSVDLQKLKKIEEDPIALLEMLIGDDIPGPFTALRLKRKLSRTNESYILMVKYIDIGSDPQNVIPISEPGVAVCHVRLFTRNGSFGIRRLTKDGLTKINDKELDVEEEFILEPGSCVLALGSLQIQVEII